MRSRAARWLLPLLILVATGCSQTLFESLPEGAVTHCDSRWPGRWQPAYKDEAGFEISADCRSVVTLKDGEPSREAVYLTLVTSAAGQFLNYRQTEGETECLDQGPCGYSLFRYVNDRDEIRLYEIDHARLAAAISAGGVRGRAQTVKPEDATKPSADTTYQNLVNGNPKQIAALLRDHPEFFNAEPFLTVRRDEVRSRDDKQP